MDTQNNLAIVALIVSLVALVVTTGQLLQQIFLTASRHRRANAQVVGPFAQTRRREFPLVRAET